MTSTSEKTFRVLDDYIWIYHSFTWGYFAVRGIELL